MNIDTPDFEAALSESRDGAFQREVQAYLEAELARVRRQMKQGLAPLEFEQARKLEAAIAMASDVVRFSTTNQKH